MLSTLEDIRKAISNSEDKIEKEILKLLLGNSENKLKSQSQKGETSKIILGEIKNLLKGIISTLSTLEERGMQDSLVYTQYLKEKEVLEEFLPLYLSSEATYTLLSNLPFSSIKEAMVAIKTHPDVGIINMALASSLINQIIKERNS